MKKRKKKNKPHGRTTEPSATDLFRAITKAFTKTTRPDPEPDVDEATRRKWHAQDLVNRAWGVGDTHAEQLTREALELDPDCAAAYLVLAERIAETPEQSRDAFAQAVAIGERSFDVSAFEGLDDEERTEQLRKIEDGEVHLAALLGLARAHWYFGEARQTIARLEEILCFDPYDRNGARWYLYNYLLYEDELEALGRLLQRYRQSTSAHWLYSNALRMFRRYGEGRKARAALARALGRKPHVPNYLLGRTALPDDVPTRVELTDEEEAVHYAAFAEEVWQKIPGAIPWLAALHATFPTPTKSSIYQLRVLLLGSEPRVWRRLLVQADTSLLDLHDILQAAFGWTNDHMHQFVVAGVIYQCDPSPWNRRVSDETRATLVTTFPQLYAAGIYEYDFGDRWTIEIQVERIVEPEPDVEYPVCIGGKRSGPPEDSGGVWQFNAMCMAIRDPKHPGFDDALAWFGDEFDPEAFDPEEVNAGLVRRRRRRSPQ